MGSYSTIVYPILNPDASIEAATGGYMSHTDGRHMAVRVLGCIDDALLDEC